MNLIIPKNYNPVLDLRDTEIAIKLVKDFFETELARALNLTRVSAPIMVTPQSGLNDNLNGVERPVSFDILETGETAEIVHSLAKWKRQALKTYGFRPGEGLYTDMNAADKGLNLSVVPEEERTLEASSHVDYKVPTSQKKPFYINCFLMPWIPDTMDEPTSTPTPEGTK